MMKQIGTNWKVAMVLACLVLAFILWMIFAKDAL